MKSEVKGLKERLEKVSCGKYTIGHHAGFYKIVDTDLLPEKPLANPFFASDGVVVVKGIQALKDTVKAVIYVIEHSK